MDKVSKIDINTVLSTNYYAADYFAGYQQVCPITGVKEELDYLVGRDQLDKLYIACPKEKGETGYTMLSTEVTTKLFDVESGYTQDEDIWIAYVKNKNIELISVAEQKIKDTYKIESICKDEERIEKLIAYRRDYILYIFVIYKSEEECFYRLKIIEYILPEKIYNTISTGFTLDRPLCDCLRDNLGIRLVGFEGRKYKYYDLFLKEEQEKEITYPGNMLCFSALNSPIDGEGILALFDVSGGKKVYAFDLETLNWIPVNLQLNAEPQELNVVYDKNFFHVFVSAKKDGILKLYHASRSMDDKRWSRELVMMPISGEITDFTINKAEETHLGVMYNEKKVDTKESNSRYGFLNANQNQIEYLVMSETGRWNSKSTVVDSGSGHVYEEKSYSTQVVFYDANGICYSGLEVEVTAQCTTQIAINNCTYHIKPGKWVTVKTNAMGQLHLSQKTDELSVPDIKIKPKDGSKEEYSIVQHDRYAKQFQSVTKEQLQEATLEDGSALVPETMREQCGELAKLICQAFSEKNYNYHLFEKNQVIAHNKAGIYCVSKHPEMIFGEFNEDANIAFKMEFGDEGTIKFTDYSGLKDIPSLIVTDGLWGRLCDFTRSVLNKTVDVISIVVQSGKKAVAATVEFVLDGVKQVVSFVVKTVKDILNSVIAIFQRFGIDFERIFQWIGQLFAWNDIMWTKEYLKSMIEDGLCIFSENIKKAGKTLSEKMDYIAKESSETAGRAKKVLPDGLDAQKESQKIPSDSPFFEGQNNIVLNRMMDTNFAANGEITAIFPMKFDISVMSLIDDIMECMDSFGNEVGPEIKRRTQIFLESFQTMQVLTMLDTLSKILKELIEFAKNPAVALVEGIGKLADNMVELLRKILNTKLQIPLVTSLLKKVFDISEITILDVVCTIIAIPTTVIHRLVCGTKFRRNSGTLGNAYGWLKSGYILSAVCVTLYYGINIAGTYTRPEEDNLISLVLFGLLPPVLLLIWTLIYAPENDVHGNSEVTDIIAGVMSGVSITILFGTFLVSWQKMGGGIRTNGLDISMAVDGITVVFGLASIVIGTIDMFNPGEWKLLDVVSQRNGILTGFADGAGALANILKGKKQVDGMRESRVAAVVSGAFALVEVLCITAEVAEKPYITSILPDEKIIGCSGEVVIVFDMDMNTEAKIGEIYMGGTKLPQGRWNGKRKYTTNYIGLESGIKYFLIVDKFTNSKKVAMEKDRYLKQTI